MTKSLRLSVLFVLSAFLLSLALPAWAENDPPSRVARLNYISGDVSFQPGGVDDWTTATLNRPLTTGDRLWTGRDARVEMHIGNAAMRLGGETSFTFANLDDRAVQIQLAQGSLNIRLRQLYDDEIFEVDTPHTSFALTRPGEYRIDVDNDGDVTTVMVRSGKGEATTAGPDVLTVSANQMARFSGRDTYEVTSLPNRDSFDEWCQSRDKREEHVQSAKYVSPSVIGYEDLDEYGYWRVYPEYGRVWIPRAVVTGWAPYRFGHWSWIYPWGWTWIDDAPWGFAPFHYGRWCHVRGVWGWVPGPIVVRPVYAPALVAWIGGSHWGIGLSFGTGPRVGWFPLGPREVYYPWHGASRNYVTRVNTTNTVINNVNITNIYNNPSYMTKVKYVNRSVPGAVTAVPQDEMSRGRNLGKFAVAVKPDELKHASIIRDVPVTPDRRSVLGREDAARVRPNEKVLGRPMVTRTAPPKPVPFDVQRKRLAEGSTGAPEATRTRPSVGGEVSRRAAVPASTEVQPEVKRTVPRPGQTESTKRTAAGSVAPHPPERIGVVERESSPAPNIEIRRPSDRVVPRPPEKVSDAKRAPVPVSERVVPRPPQNVTDDRPARTNASREVPRPGNTNQSSPPIRNREVQRPGQSQGEVRPPRPAEARTAPRPTENRTTQPPSTSEPKTQRPVERTTKPAERKSEPTKPTERRPDTAKPEERGSKETRRETKKQGEGSARLYRPSSSQPVFHAQGSPATRPEHQVSARFTQRAARPEPRRNG